MGKKGKGCVARAFFCTSNPESLSAMLNDSRFPVERFMTGNYDDLPHEEIAKKILSVWTSSKDDRTGCIVLCKGGDNGLYHAHLALYSLTNTTGESVNRLLAGSFYEKQFGSKKALRDYMLKEGDYANNDEKVYFSYGMEVLGDKRKKGSKKSNDPATAGGNHYEELLELVKDGKTDKEIIEENPVYMRELNTIATLRDMFRPVTNYREVKVTYIFGPTGTGKTRFVRDNSEIPIDQIYSANGNHPFDGYTGQDVLLFDEFRADYPLKDMLRYLDNYCTTLSARYHDKISAYTRVFIVSNWELEKQYEYERTTDKETYKAFLRRISEVLWIMGDYIVELRPDIEKWYTACKGNIDAYNWYKDIDWPRGIIRYTSVDQYLSRNRTSGIINRGKPLVDSPPVFNL